MINESHVRKKKNTKYEISLKKCNKLHLVEKSMLQSKTKNIQQLTHEILENYQRAQYSFQQSMSCKYGSPSTKGEYFLT